MCGLLVFLDDSRVAPYKRMQALQAISHRGYDNTVGIHSADGVTMCHTRLPIQDRSARYNQPLFDAHGHPGVYVGEVFNLPGGNDALSALIQVTTSGPEKAKEFDGFFAMCYWYRDRVFVQTDHLGIKPLYFDTETLTVASELKAIAQVRDDHELDREWYGNAIKWGYDPSGRTPYKNVHRIPPGTWMSFDPKVGEPSLRCEKYWDIREDVPHGYSMEYLILRSVHDRATLSDVPVATLCSGGLDSTIITMLALQQRPDMKVFHVANGDDSAHFYRLAETFPQETTVVEVDIRKYEDSRFFGLEAAVLAADVPCDLGSVLPQYALAQELKQHGVEVVLSGDGADELFGGYQRSKRYDSQFSDVFRELPHYHLPRLDAIVMSQTIELRCPFLAPTVVRKAFDIPWEQRQTKQALKKVAHNLDCGVPEFIINREKLALKTQKVITGGEEYRKSIIDNWRETVCL